MKPSRIVIVGAGISGLSLGYELQSRDPESTITVLESSNRIGGKIWTETIDGFTVEHGPNGFLDNNPSTYNLCQSVGLTDQLVAASESANKNRFLLINGQLRALPNSLVGLAASDLLSWRGKFRLLTEPFRFRGAKITDESVAAFARRRIGREAADLFFNAMVAGIHAGDAEQLSLQSAFPRLAAMERQYGSLLRGVWQTAGQRKRQGLGRAKMWSLNGGLRLMVKTVAGRLLQPPILGVQIRRIEKSGDSWMVHGEGQDCWPADKVLLTCSARQQASLLADLDPQLAELIGGIAYNRIAVVAVGFREADVAKPADGFGFIAPRPTDSDVLGVQWCSSIFPKRSPDGTVLWRALVGGARKPEMVDWNDERLVGEVVHVLRSLHRINEPPIFTKVIRWPEAIPQYVVGHQERLMKIEQRLKAYPGLQLAGNAFRGIAVNDCVIEATNVAELVRVQHLGR